MSKKPMSDETKAKIAASIAAKKAAKQNTLSSQAFVENNSDMVQQAVIIEAAEKPKLSYREQINAAGNLTVLYLFEYFSNSMEEEEAFKRTMETFGL